MLEVPLFAAAVALLAVREPGAPPAEPASPGSGKADAGVSPSRSGPAAEGEGKTAFRETTLQWDNAVTAETIGVGGDYQSSNPTYEMGLSLRPRFHFYEVGDDAFFVAGRLDVVREMTNSDVTTRRGETTLTDAVVFTSYQRRLAKEGDYETKLGLRVPILTLPTSTFSANNGTILGLGTGVRLEQKVPLAGSDAPWFRTALLRGYVAYAHTFTEAEVPTNPELRRVRLDPEGRTVPGDQLTGAAFPEHEMRLDITMIAQLTGPLSWLVGLSYRPTWKYAFAATDVCITTGCERVPPSRDPARYIVVTAFETGLSYQVLEPLSIDLGYSNVATQPGPDGRRRSVFHSPGAQVALSVVADLDALYGAAARRGSGGGTRTAALH